jgi:hypothetical protein
MATTQVIHYPNLKTVLAVEGVLKKAQSPITKYQILKRLEKKVMKQTLNTIISYLDERGMIHDGEKGIVWTYQPASQLNKRIAKGLEV